MPDYNHFTTTIIKSKSDNKYVNKCKNYYNNAFLDFLLLVSKFNSLQLICKILIIVVIFSNILVFLILHLLSCLFILNHILYHYCY